MGITLFGSIAAAASTGMGCGTCCGSGISAALYGYLATHVRDLKQSFRAFLDFFIGKFLAVIGLCCAASLAGSRLIDEDGLLAGIRVGIIVDGAMLGMGIYLLAGWIRERRGHGSCSCKHCGRGKVPDEEKRPSRAALIGMGVGYGISPCAPLILMTGYAATLPLGYAAVLGAVFALASTVSPVLFMLLISGVLAKRMRKEIPQYLTWFRLGCYILLILLFAVGLIKELMLI